MGKLQEGRSLPSLEGLRLIASIMIVASHYLQYLHVPTKGLQLAVDLFFVISGIVIAMVYQGRVDNLADYFNFVRRRIARLYPLHVATLLFYVVLGALIATVHVVPMDVERYNPGEILPNLLMVHAWFPHGVISYNYVSWSISAEFFVYLCFPLILYVVGRFVAGLAACIVLLLAAIALSHILVGDELPELNWRFGALRALPSFAFGVWLWVHRDQLSRAVLLQSCAFPAVAAGVVGLVTLMVFYPADYLLLACVYVVAVSAFVCDLTGRGTFASWAPISSRGYLTYSIYMMHTVIATIVISFIFPRLLGRSQGAIVAAVACSAVLTCAIAYASYWYFETPLRSYIGGSGSPSAAKRVSGGTT